VNVDYLKRNRYRDNRTRSQINIHFYIFQKMKKSLIILAILVINCMAMTYAKMADKEAARLHRASEVLDDFSKMKETIPHELIAEYEGIVIIPRLINAGIGIGAKRGKGIAVIKLPGGRWSDPVFVTLSGGSIGPQVGVQSVDLILVFRHKDVLSKVKNGDFTIGGDISAAAGPVGRSSSANTDYKLEAEVYSYSRSRGLFVGISINGCSLSIDENSNHAFYGSDVTSSALFETSKNNSAEVKSLKKRLAVL
jgi:lipid-binding SYLF domain-containing protein